MLREVLIETAHLDEHALRQRLALLIEQGWQLQACGRCWLLRLDEPREVARLYGKLLACRWVRRLDFSAG